MSIRVEALSKRYWLRAGRPATAQEALARALRRRIASRPFWALREVTFHVAEGESVCVVGDNGAGKSTLLRMICRLGRPTRGSVSATGRIAALLELGAGFHPQLTGRENLYVSAITSGMRRSEVDARLGEIVDFAGVASFLDQPLRAYSTGMQLRLAFSVAIHVDPGILVVDEALAVGDAGFQSRCVERIEAFHRRGRTLLVVSHDLGLLRSLCQRAIRLERGRVVADGPAAEVIDSYGRTRFGETAQRATPARRFAR